MHPNSWRASGGHEGGGRGFGRGGRGGRPGGGGGWGGWGGGGGRGGPGGSRRVINAGELRLLLLSLISHEPRHGYDLIRAIEALSGDAYAPSPGIVYPALAALTDVGHAAASEEAGGRRTFTATAEGEAELATKKTEIEVLVARLGGLGGVDRERHAPVRRAMDNLKAVLGDAFGRETPVDPHDIAALIDEAASKIERLG